jgi:hypothetical protein
MMKLFNKKQENFYNLLGNKLTVSLFKENNKLKSEPIIFNPPATKEWFDSIYAYNKSYIKSLVHKDNIVNNLIRSYFNLNLLGPNADLKFRRRRIKSRRYSAKRIFVSRAEIKHTNNKVIITVYTYNKHKNFFLYKLKKLKNSLLLSKKMITNLHSNSKNGIPSIINLYLKSLNINLFKEFINITINKDNFNKLFINIKREFISLPQSLKFIYLLKYKFKKSFSIKRIMLY